MKINTTAEARLKLDLAFRRAETKEKISKAKYDDATTIIRKLEVLELLLSGHRPVDDPLSSPLKGESTTWIPIITEPYDLKVIRNKVVELVKKL